MKALPSPYPDQFEFLKGGPNDKSWSVRRVDGGGPGWGQNLIVEESGERYWVGPSSENEKTFELIPSLAAWEQKIYSQNGEDGITLRLLREILTPSNNNPKAPMQRCFYVEFGVEDGHECNTRILWEEGEEGRLPGLAWAGLLMDGGAKEGSRVKKAFVTRENILVLFKGYGVPQHIEVLSIDIDYNDYYILEEILKGGFTLDLIICEVNTSHGPDEDKVVLYDAKACWDLTNYFGASLLALTRLVNRYGYSLVYVESKGVNVFFVRDDILLPFPDRNDVKRLYRPPQYGWPANGGGHLPDPYHRPYTSSGEIQ